MTKQLRIVFFLFILISACIGFYYYTHPLATRLLINNTTITIELALTNEEKTRGLGFRKSLNPDSGMLFVYDHKEAYPFWMYGMQFPIDIIWISDLTVVDISPNVPVSHETPLPVYTPKVPVNMVLELNAGKAAAYNIQIGDRVQILKR